MKGCTVSVLQDDKIPGCHNTLYTCLKLKKKLIKKNTLNEASQKDCVLLSFRIKSV